MQSVSLNLSLSGVSKISGHVKNRMPKPGAYGESRPLKFTSIFFLENSLCKSGKKVHITDRPTILKHFKKNTKGFVIIYLCYVKVYVLFVRWWSVFFLKDMHLREKLLLEKTLDQWVSVPSSKALLKVLVNRKSISTCKVFQSEMK